MVHNISQKSDSSENIKLKYTGLDLVNGKIKNNYAAGVLEPTINKVKTLKYATEAAITILRVDDFIYFKENKEDKAKK